MRLEGRVIGPDGQPIVGAIVVLEATSSRTATTGANGRFSFDRLDDHVYAVYASAGELVAGPVRYMLPAPPRPLVLRLMEGAFKLVTVVDEAAQPIAGAQIRVGNGAPVSSTQTGARGTATLGPLPQGTAWVEVNASGYAPAVRPIMSRSGTHDEITIVLVRGTSVSGRILDENHDPIANARITAAMSTRVVSNERGEFVIPALAPDRHLLRVEADEHATMWWPLMIAGTPISGIEIVMKEGGVISGIVLDARRTPARFATILVAGGTTVLTTADRTGAFELRGWSRSSLRLYAEAASATSEVVSVDLSEKPQAAVELVLDRVGTVEGTVVDEHGASLAGIAVIALSDEVDVPARFRQPVTSRESVTDDEGRFVLRGLPEVAMRMAAKPRKLGRASPWSQCAIAKVGDRDVQIRLVSDGQLTGRIVVDHADAPPRNVAINLGIRLSATANRDGSFQLREVPPGTYDVVFYSPDFTVFGKRDVQIQSGATTDLGTVTAMPGRMLAGQVLDTSGKPVGAAQIDFGVIHSVPSDDEAPSSGFRLYRTIIAKRDGTFKVELPPEPLTAFASDPDYATSAPVAIPGGPSAPPAVTFVLADAPDDR